EVRITRLHGLDDLAASPARLGRVSIPSVGGRVALLLVPPERALIRLRVEQQSWAPGCAGNAGGKVQVVEDRAVIIKPIEVGGGHIDPQEIIAKAAEARGPQVIQAALDRRVRTRPSAPHEPGKIAVAAGWVPGREMKDTPVKRRALKLGDVLAHETRVRL